MANEKILKLDQLNIIKAYIDSKDAASIKGAEYANNIIKLYTTADKSGEPTVELNLPEEMFLDQAKTAFAAEFAWSNETYPGSVNPNLNGKPVLILAVKGDTTVSYSFISIEALVKTYSGDSTSTATINISGNIIKTDVKISAEDGNALTVKSDGLFVSPSEKITLEYATDEEIQALFSD